MLNVIFILIIIFLGRELFALKNLVSEQLIGQLYYNFVLMDQASIKDNVRVNQDMPVQFDLRVNANTTVVLTQDTRISGAQVGVLSSPTDIVLPAGTQLPIKLDMVVPVNTIIPVNLDVPVDIQLSQTELHEPFTGLQDVVSPYFNLLNTMPSSWGDWFCGTIFGFLCG